MFSPSRGLVLGLATLAVTTVVLATPFQDKPDREPPSPEVQTAQGVMGKLLGTWTTNMTMGEGVEPVKGLSTIKAVAGSTFVYEEYKAQMGGQPFMGLGLMGYDADIGQWRGVWVDSAEPGMAAWTGDWDEDAHSITSRSEASGDKPAQKGILKMTGRDSMTYSMGEDVEDFKPSMVIFYQRRK